ncbi:DMT family transporter [Chitinivorax sp. B]|uniref:DMT family transporter n=1 Tax=Chitinivorax sp. B TaxID=2502235 RepID=UPI001484F148|nr:DMT family transporter [Chitinivorax sp. B]
MVRGVSFGVMAGALWGGIFLVPQWLPGFSSWELSAGRYLAYGLLSLLMLVPVWRECCQGLTRRDWLALVKLSLLGNLVYYVLVVLAVQRVGVAPTSLIIGCLPVLVAMLGARAGAGLSLRKLTWSLVTIVLGAGCIAGDVWWQGRQMAAGAWFDRLLGLVCAVGALSCWGLYAVHNAQYLQRRPALGSKAWSLLTGVVTGGLALIMAVPIWGMTSNAPADKSWLGFCWLMLATALGASVIGNALWNAACRRLPLTLSGQLIVFETLFALFYGFLHESRGPRLLEWLAMGLMLGGVTYAAYLHREIENDSAH